MKKGNLLEGILFVLTGIILLGVALLADSVLDRCRWRFEFPEE